MFRKEWLAGALVLGIVAAVAAIWLAPPAREPAPELDLTMLSGDQRALSEFRNGPVMVVFWATSCTTCVAEMPEIVELHNTLAPAGLTILGVAMSYDPVDRVQALVEQRQLPYPIVIDHDGEIARSFNEVRVTPTTVLIDADGGVVWQRIGLLDFHRVEQEVRRLLPSEQSA